MSTPSIPRWIWPAILVAAILSSISIAFRYRVESHNKAATIALEYETVEGAALGQGMPVEAALKRLQTEGAGAIVLGEETVGDLINLHAVEVVAGPKIQGPPVVLQTIQRAMARRFAGYQAPIQGDTLDFSSPDAPTIFNLRALSIGLDDKEAKDCLAAGLTIIGRYGNPVGANTAYVKRTLEEAKRQGVTIFLPVGDQVLGRRSAMKEFEDGLQEQGMYYASPEFAKMGGDTNVVTDIPRSVIRLHSAQSAELDKLPEVEAVDRFARAARERNQRILLLRPLDFSSPKPLESLAEFVIKVDKEVRAQGAEIGPAKPFEDPKVPPALFALIGLALAAPIWAAAAFFVQSRTWRMVGAGLIALLGAACVSHVARAPMAFLAAVAFPILAFQILAFQILEARTGKAWIVEYVLVTFVSLVGGLGVAGLLNGLPYYIRAEEFQGVKAAVFLPILVVGVMLHARLANFKSALRDPILWGQAVLALIMLGALAFMISRTGNDNPAGVSGFELKLRSLLDAILFVRPRTKEFLIGHPALVLGICMLIKMRSGWKAPRGFAGWTVLMLAVGAMGQTDVVNTMCHFHTPVALSLARIGIGLIAGGILGAIAWFALAFFLPKGNPTDEGAESPPTPMRSGVAH